MSKPDGGYAFPMPIATGPSGDLYAAPQAEFGSGGMTLRDYLASVALMGMNVYSGMSLDHPSFAASAEETDRLRAESAYRQADAMLAERAK
jgi:hypothetical protein